MSVKLPGTGSASRWVGGGWGGCRVGGGMSGKLVNLTCLGDGNVIHRGTCRVSYRGGGGGGDLSPS